MRSPDIKVVVFDNINCILETLISRISTLAAPTPAGAYPSVKIFINARLDLGNHFIDAVFDNQFAVRSSRRFKKFIHYSPQPSQIHLTESSVVQQSIG